MSGHDGQPIPKDKCRPLATILLNACMYCNEDGLYKEANLRLTTATHVHMHFEPQYLAGKPAASY